MAIPDPHSVDDALPARWDLDRVQRWYEALPWPLGCNFVPSTAVNQLEMWDRSTFDPATIDRELGMAAGLGFTMVRVFLHDLLWRDDPSGLSDRLDQFLSIATDHGISTMPVFLDGCWNNYGHAGAQPDPVPGVHNSQWVQSPQSKIIVDRNEWSPLRDYIQEVMDAYRDDERITIWDLYNEPGNEGLMGNALPLVEATFHWAREVNPSQPITVAIWNTEEPYRPLNDFQLAASDVVSFHWYANVDSTRELVERLTLHGRPVLCTEYLARTMDSHFETHLPMFHEHAVGALHWGLVKGRIQTHQPWFTSPGDPESDPWFHDVLHPDGTPFDEAEAALLRSLSPRDDMTDPAATAAG